MKFEIRDDDLSYFAEPDVLEFIYSRVWDKYPINFATIPKVISSQTEAPLDKSGLKKFYWLGENKVLVSFIKKKIKEGKINIWQHGFTHKDYGDTFELERTDYARLVKELKEGKAYLEDLFPIKIDTLVAPHDRFSKEAILAANKAGFKRICRAFAPLPREIQLNKAYLKSFYKLGRFFLKYGKKTFRYPTELDFGTHKEVYAYRIQEFDAAKIDKVVKFHKDGQLLVTNHYRTMNLQRIEILEYLVKKVLENEKQKKN